MFNWTGIQLIEQSVWMYKRSQSILHLRAPEIYVYVEYFFMRRLIHVQLRIFIMNWTWKFNLKYNFRLLLLLFLMRNTQSKDAESLISCLTIENYELFFFILHRRNQTLSLIVYFIYIHTHAHNKLFTQKISLSPSIITEKK